MPTEADPLVDNWYAHLDKGQRFWVVAADADVVEIQYFDGTLEELERDAWYQLDIEPAEAPENWSGPADIAEADDLGTGITDTSAADWDEPAQEFRAATEEADDDWGEGRPEEEPLDREP